MFLVEDQRLGTTSLVFTVEDPQKAGYKGSVIEGVKLDYDIFAVHEWADGAPRPEACVGRDPDNPKHYKVFKYKSDLQNAKYEFVPGKARVFESWPDYLRAFHPDLLDDERWYAYLDQLDEDARVRRRRRNQEPSGPVDNSRDQVAAWVARKHFIVDYSVREVWYLPHGAPEDEIRLLELNDQTVGNESRVSAIDFGLDVEGSQFKLMIADISSDQLDQIKQNLLPLPPKWSLEEKTVWRRGA